MNYNIGSILTGFLILFAASYLLLALFNFVFLGFTEYSEEVKGKKLLSDTLAIVLAWVLITLVLVVTAGSVNIWVFTLLAFILLFWAGFFYAGKILHFEEKKEQIIYAIMLAVIANPIWLTFLKIL